ncbi:MAG TPA: S8 family serine peptidase [Gemmatimonadales bacterium]|jgi:hypothetical protein
MRRILGLGAVLVFAVTACSDEPTAVPTPDGPDFAQSAGAPIYLVTFTGDVTDVPGTARELARSGGFTLRHVREHAARGFSAVVPERFLGTLRSDPRVALVERDGPVSLIFPVRPNAPPWCDTDPSDPRCGGGGGEDPPSAQTTPWGITRVGGSGDGTGKTAWIIDTGIDLGHADLNTSRDCHANFVTRGKNSPKDGHGHGTHVAGTVAAIDNNADVVGVAANAWVCAVRVLDNGGSGTWEWVMNGVNHVAANGASGDVANMSLGGSGSNTTLENAIKDAAGKGIRFSIAAGNSGANANNYTPARVDHANVYTISAIGDNDCMPSWSNYGNPPVDFAAPGVGVLSTKKGGGTTTFSGTSMAAPHVAGLLLLGNVRSDGTACNDPDGNPDAIAHR